MDKLSTASDDSFNRLVNLLEEIGIISRASIMAARALPGAATGPITSVKQLREFERKIKK